MINVNDYLPYEPWHVLRPVPPDRVARVASPSSSWCRTKKWKWRICFVRSKSSELQEVLTDQLRPSDTKWWGLWRNELRRWIETFCCSTFVGSDQQLWLRPEFLESVLGFLRRHRAEVCRRVGASSDPPNRCRNLSSGGRSMTRIRPSLNEWENKKFKSFT